LTNYRTYGFCVASSFVLPELVRVHCAADVTIKRGTADHVPNATVNEDGHEVSEGDVRLAFENVGAFRIRDGEEIVVEPCPGADAAVVRLSLLGPALGVLLHQRGLLVLHASSVVMDGAVAFLGESEWGKSTTAAALYRAGWPLVADDLLAVDLRSGSPVVPAAFPQVKLWPESVEALGIEPHRMRTIHPDLEKRALRAAAGFHDDDELPLSRVYVLSDGPEIGAEVLGEQEAFLELVRHSYAASLLRDSKTEHAHFEQCSSLAATGSVRRLTLGGSIERIPELIRAVEEDRGKASVSVPVAV
jgi:hypothetical protein